MLFGSWNIAWFEAINGLSGTWPFLDKLVSLALRNELLKSVPVAACLIAAWHATPRHGNRTELRVALLVTLAGALLAAGSSKLISRKFAMPRPYVLSQVTYRLQGEELIEQPRWPFTRPSDSASRQRYEQLLRGHVPENDMGTFPSDHAALFLTLALGTCWVSRGWGALALAWTLMVVLLPRIWVGLHSPVDLLGGAALACIALLGMATVGRVLLARPLESAAEWTLRYESISTAVVFIVLLEMSATFEHAEALGVGLVKNVGSSAIGR